MPAPEGLDLSFPEDGGCFGCSPSNAAGLRLTFRRDGGRVRARIRVAETFHGAPGVVHGGIVATLLDEISCAAAVFVGDRRVVTGELTVRYERPVPVEEAIELVAEITSQRHPRYAEIAAEVRRDGECLARSTGKFFYHEHQVTP